MQNHRAYRVNHLTVALTIVALFSLTVLSGCASANGPEQTAVQAATLTFTPPPATLTATKLSATVIPPTNDPTCPTLDLEKWLRNATPNTQGFIELLNRSANTTQPQAKQIASQLASFETQINTVTAPPCATALNGQIAVMITDVVNAFVTLSNDPRTSLQTTIQSANTRYLQVAKDQQTLLTQLNVQLGQ